jgi:hypothetical protein
MPRAFIGPRLTRLIPAFAASCLLASIGAPTAHACSLVPSWQYRQASRLEFIGVALPDTVFAAAGTTTFNNEAALRGASIEFGLQYRAFATMLQFDMQGVLSVLTATPNTAGHSHLDQFDGRGNLMRSAWLFDRQGTGVRLMGVVPAASSQELWAVSAGGRRVMRLRVDWW